MARFEARTRLLTFPLTQPRKTTGPFWFFSQSHEKVEKETFKACARPMLSELQKANLILADSVLDCTRQELWKKCVRGIMTPELMRDHARVLAALPTGTLPTGPRSIPRREMSWITCSDCNIFPNGQNKGLRGQWLRLCATSL